MINLIQPNVSSLLHIVLIVTTQNNVLLLIMLNGAFKKIMEFVLLESFDNYIDANLVLGRMEEAGINCWLKDENTATVFPIISNSIGGIKLMVEKDQLQNATEILNTLKEIKRKSFSCPNCGSHNIEYINSPRKAANIISSVLTWFLGSYAIGLEQIWHCYNCNKEFEEPVSNNNYADEENQDV